VVVTQWNADTLEVLREDALVMFANMSGQLDLSIFPEVICIPVLDGLLHWASCGAACAIDPMPTMLAGTSFLSPYRLALESLCKLCITDSNVDLVLATPPFSRIVRVLTGLVRTMADPASDQVLREFAIVLASCLVAGDVTAARAIALHRPTVTVLLEFIEAADRQAQQLVQTQGSAMLRESPEMMGTSVDMLRRAASILHAIAETPDGRALFTCHQSRLLHLTISQTLDSSIVSTLANVLFLCSTSGV
jgi:AT-rich interactive domain-containing protein 1